MPIRVIGIPEIWRDQYTVNLLHDNKHGIYRGSGNGGQARGTGQRYTKKRMGDTKKRSGRNPKLYTGKKIIETSPKLQAAYKPYFEA